MKLVATAIGIVLGASLVACGAGNNGGWVTKHGWDPASRAGAPKQGTATVEQSDIPLSALDLENPYLRPASKSAEASSGKRHMVDESPWGESRAHDSAKAKTDGSEKKLKADEPGF